MPRRSLEKPAEKLTVAQAARYITEVYFDVSEAGVRGRIASGKLAAAVERDEAGLICLNKAKLDEILQRRYRARPDTSTEVVG